MVIYDSRMIEQIKWSKSYVFMSNCSTRVITMDNVMRKSIFMQVLNFILSIKFNELNIKQLQFRFEIEPKRE